MVPFVAGLAAAPEEPDGDVVLRFTDAEVVESSGLVVDGALDAGALVVTVNDSGDEARVFTVDPATGATVGVTGWSVPGGEPVDVEALAPAGPGRVWVGDIGDNPGEREELLLYDVPVGRGDRDVGAEPLVVTYPDGPHDAETLLRHPRTGQLVVVTKEVLGGTAYALPAGAAPGDTVEARPLGGVLPLATDGAFLPDGRHLVVRGYGSAQVYAWPSLETVGGSFGLPRQPQGEGLAVDADGRVLVSSEGVRQPVREVTLPVGVRAVVGPPPTSTAPTTGSTGRTDEQADSGDEGGEALSRRSWPWGAGVLVVTVLAALAAVRRPRQHGRRGPG